MTLVRVLLVGHSHAVGLQAVAFWPPTWRVEFLNLMDADLDPCWDWTAEEPTGPVKARLDALLGEVDLVLLSLAGNEGHESGLLEHREAQRWSTHTPTYGAVGVGPFYAFSLLEGHLDSYARSLRGFVGYVAAHTSGRVAVLPPPPPLRDATFIQAQLEGHYADRLHAQGLRIAPASHRLAWYDAVCSLRRRAAELAGAWYFDPPQDCCDREGFLNEGCSMENNATHANAEYSAATWRAVTERFGLECEQPR